MLAAVSTAAMPEPDWLPDRFHHIGLSTRLKGRTVLHSHLQSGHSSNLASLT